MWGGMTILRASCVFKRGDLCVLLGGGVPSLLTTSTYANLAFYSVQNGNHFRNKKCLVPSPMDANERKLPKSNLGDRVELLANRHYPAKRLVVSVDAMRREDDWSRPTGLSSTLSQTDRPDRTNMKRTDCNLSGLQRQKETY